MALNPAVPGGATAPVGGPFRLGTLGLSRDDGSVLRWSCLAAIVAWVPTMLLALIDPLGSGRIPLVVFRFDTHVRAFAIPLLALAEIAIELRIAQATAHLRTSGYVAPEELAVVHELEVDFERRRASRRAEWFIVALTLVSLGAAPFLLEGRAAWWSYVVGAALFRFFLLRALWRWLAWAMFLARVSRLRLRLEPTHPDRSGGLGFLSQPSDAFGLLAFVVASVVAAGAASEIRNGALHVSDLKVPLFLFALVVVLVAVGPLLVFLPRLIELRHRGLRQYGAFALGYTARFADKWLRSVSSRDAGAEALGSQDIQSLADLGTAYGVIESMRPVPFAPRTAVAVAVAVALPLIPVLATEIPPHVILKTVLQGF